MDSQNMIEKLKSRDAASFRELMRSYGKTLYPKLLSRFGSKELADEAFRRTMLQFYDMVTETEGNDPLEILLLSCADSVETQLVTESLNEVLNELSGATPLPQSGTAPQITRPVYTPPQPTVTAAPEMPAPQTAQSVYTPPQPTVTAAPETPAPQTMRYVYAPPETETEKEEPVRTKPKKMTYVPLILLTILALVLAWVVAGELIHTELLPYANLGYETVREFCIQLFDRVKLYIVQIVGTMNI